MPVRLEAIETRDADPQVVSLADGELDVASRAAELCHNIAMSLATQPDQADTLAAKLSDFKTVNTTIRNECEILRVLLVAKYDTPFPELEEITRRPNKAAGGDQSKNAASGPDHPGPRLSLRGPAATANIESRRN